MSDRHGFRSRRERLGLTQAEVARRAGLPPYKVSTIERGVGNPTLASLAGLAHALDAELLLVPRERLPAVRAALGRPGPRPAEEPTSALDDLLIPDPDEAGDG